MSGLVDPLALWKTLSPDVQEYLGALAIANELAAMGATSDSLGMLAIDAFERIANECYGEISDIIVECLPDAFDGMGEPLRPDLNKLGIRQCTSCGCTEANGCSWAAATLCTGCVPGEAA